MSYFNNSLDKFDKAYLFKGKTVYRRQRANAGILAGGIRTICLFLNIFLKTI
jgi:hypothetical protein